jgi:hypothetical protein
MVGLTLGSLPTISIADADLIKKALNKDELQGRPFNAALANHVGLLNGEQVPGIIFSESKVWTENRRAALHNLRDLGFGKSSMEQIIQDEMLECTSRLNKLNGQPEEYFFCFGYKFLAASTALCCFCCWIITHVQLNDAILGGTGMLLGACSLDHGSKNSSEYLDG